MVIYILECEVNFYGINCQHRCGNCKNGTICDINNGQCTDGCQIWWTGTKCNVYIGNYKLYNYMKCIMGNI